MKKIVVVILIGIMSWSCSTQNVSVDYDKSANFSEIKTYSFDHNQLSINELDSIRLYQIIENQLSLKAMRKVSENPDVQIQIVPKEYQTSRTNSSVGLGLGTGLGVLGGIMSVGVPIRTKKLNQNFVVSMKKQDHLIWQGILTIESPSNISPEQKSEKIKNGVSKLLKNYPPYKK